MLNVSNILNDLVNDMFAKGKSYHGKPLTSLRPLVEVQGNSGSGRVLVPFWWSTLQHGRGKRETTKTEWRNFKGYKMSTMQRAIYRWMQKNGRFTAQSDAGRINEAKSVTWYINKHGNKHFQERRYIDIYDTLVNETVNDMTAKVGQQAVKIASELVDL